MNTVQLLKYMKRNDKDSIFKGVFPCDRLPDSFSLPAGFIVNLSPSHSEGTHWISIFIDEQKNCELFDSFGVKMHDVRILNFLKKHGNKVIFADKQLQHLKSHNCGKFAAVYNVFRMHKKTLSDFQQLFCNNLFINDSIIERFYNYFKK